MQDHLDQGVVRSWVPDDAEAIPADYRTDDYVGVDLLYVVAVVHEGVAAPSSWADLAGPDYTGRVAIPDPGFAASALGLLGYLDAAPDYGTGLLPAARRQRRRRAGQPDRRAHRRRAGHVRRRHRARQCGVRGAGRRFADRGGVAGAWRGRDLRADSADHPVRSRTAGRGVRRVRRERGGAAGDRADRRVPRARRTSQGHRSPTAHQ